MPGDQSTPLPESPMTQRVMWGVMGIILVVFFGILTRFGPTGGNTTLSWLVTTWTPETNYEHGWLVVALTGWLLWRARPGFLAEKAAPSNWGLAILALGVLIFVGGWRLIQPRVNVVALPVLIYGAVVYIHGWARARHWIFPLSMTAFVIPMPGLQQATTGLQIIATKMAYYASTFMGMDSILSGNRIFDPTGEKGSWEIDEGCSGIRSVVALTLVTYVYGMIAHKKWSERLMIFAACIPIAILANAVRVTSILIVARINVNFAKTTWHDYSGFMSFGAALALLMLLSTVMRHGLKALRPKVKVTTVTRPAAGSPKPAATAAAADPY
jgi:exosortase